MKGMVTNMVIIIGEHCGSQHKLKSGLVPVEPLIMSCLPMQAPCILLGETWQACISWIWYPTGLLVGGLASAVILLLRFVKSRELDVGILARCVH